MIGFAFEVEQGDIFDGVFDGVGNDTFSVNAEKATLVTGVGLFQDEFLIAQVKESVKIRIQI